MSIIGVDYGSKNITVAQAAGMGGRGGGGIKIVLNEGSGRFTPNLVSFEGAQRFAGSMAATKIRSNYKNTVTHVKRLIGRKFSDPEVQETIKRLHFKVEQLETDEIGCVVQFEGKRRVFVPEQIVAFELANMKQFSEAYTGASCTDIVMSVPAYFSDRQRRAMLDACEIAGIRCYRLINDTTATALSYGILRKSKLTDEPKHVMFLDMGDNDFQVSIVGFTSTGMSVKSTACDANLGSYDIDVRIAEFLNKRFMEKHKVDLREFPKSWIKLMGAAEKAKKTMSPVGVNKARISLECLHRELDFRTELTIQELEELTVDLMPKLITVINKALADAEMTMADLSSCEATGGSIRMRFVRKTIIDCVGADKMSFTLNADECTARGCAIMSAMISPKVKVLPFDIADAVQTPIRLTWQQTDAMDIDGAATKAEAENSLVIFKKCDNFPKEMKLTFKRKKSFKLNAVYDNLSRLASGTPKLVGTFQVDMKNAEAAVKEWEAEQEQGAKKPEVRVFLSFDANGIVTVNRAVYMKKNKQPEPEPEPEAAKAAEPAADTPAPAEAKADDAAGKTEEGDAAAAEKEAAAPGGEAPAAKEGKEGTAEDKAGKAKAEDKAEAEDKEAPKPKKSKTEEPKKKKVKKVPKFTQIQLTVTRLTPFGLSSKVADDYRTQEFSMQNQGRMLKERDEARNSLESFVYSIRDTLDDEELQEFMAPEFKEQYYKQLEDMEEWLYSEAGFESAKKVYLKKLTALQKEGDAVPARKLEFEKRPEATKRFNATIQSYLAKAAAKTEAQAHWDEADRKTLTDACAAAEAWLQKVSPALEAASKHVDAPTAVAEIEKEEQTLHTACRPVITKPVPKKEEPKKKEEAKKEKKEGEKKTEEEGAGKKEEAATDEKAEADKADTKEADTKEEAKEGASEAEKGNAEAAAAGGDPMETD